MDYLKERCKAVVYSIPESEWNVLIDLIISKEKIFVYGSGRSGLIGQLFSVRMVQLGLNVHFVGDMTTPIIGKNDLTLLISNTGRTMSVVQTAEIARRVGSHVVSLTSSGTSKLAAASNTTIIFNITKYEADSKLAPLGTIFEDTVLFFFDCIVPELMRRLNVTEEDMRKRHAIWV
ncbi:3-hexulose-6-phosphate isomerase [Candidatus Methanoplasma termitum]|uniref:Phi protein n=1 Tax=Candidatus Methanoplasma termitum TaxID=1577791 RepID=A0A0A7LEJ2_9ARCH|nr:SIS domain-containing protein [Candidatus Methanoplasma termitum]AIZ55946.1 3-hexulose-6-phosphate isomerase [Candidatus Methanoplasma termitum]MCL2334264.1 SIS domain-containing protein [Candidatus Methanoplasma sp.]